MMERTIPVTMASACLLIMGLASCGPGRPAGPSPAADRFYAPSVRPSSRYVIDARVDVAGGSVEGRETVTLKNSGRESPRRRRLRLGRRRPVDARSLTG